LTLSGFNRRLTTEPQNSSKEGVQNSAYAVRA